MLHHKDNEQWIVMTCNFLFGYPLNIILCSKSRNIIHLKVRQMIYHQIYHVKDNLKLDNDMETCFVLSHFDLVLMNATRHKCNKFFQAFKYF